MFHDVRNAGETNYPNRYRLKSFLNFDQFYFQINRIKNKYKIISSLDLKNLDLNENIDYAILSFDDGLRDHYGVYLHLKSLEIPGSFFVPKMPIIENKVMNTHKIQFILASADEKKITNEILNLFDNKDEIWEKYSRTEWKNNWWSKEMIFVTNFLRYHRDDLTDNIELTNYFFKKFVTEDEFNFSKDLYLNETQIEEMSNNSMVIGGHGDKSENLLFIDDYRKEIGESKKFVSRYSDKFIFSFPNGGFNEEIKNHLRENNCFTAYTTKPMTITDLDDIDYLEFPRYDSPQKIELP
jgi:hypothetical protein